MTTIVCELEDCIHYFNRGGKPGRCKCDVIGVKRLMLPLTLSKTNPTCCDSYMQTPEILKDKS